MRSSDLIRRLHDFPFKPFRIRMLNSSVYEVSEPWMVTPGRSSAVVVTQVGRDGNYPIALDWKTIAIDHITEFSDLPTKEKTKSKAK